jgi:hypothetical protein
MILLDEKVRVPMRKVTLELDKDELPVQYGVTTGSFVAQFYGYASAVVAEAAHDAPEDALSIEVETEYEGIFYTKNNFSPKTTALGKNTEWVSASKVVEWVEVRQAKERSVILSFADGMYFVACTSEEFMMTLILSDLPANFGS